MDRLSILTAVCEAAHKKVELNTKLAHEILRNAGTYFLKIFALQKYLNECIHKSETRFFNLFFNWKNAVVFE